MTMLTKEQLRLELITAIGMDWRSIAANPGVLWDHLPYPSFDVAFDPLCVSVDPTSEIWCSRLLGLNDDGFLGLAGFNPPELPVFFTLYHDGAEWKYWLPKRCNSFNPATKTAFGVDEEADKAYWMGLKYPHPGDITRIERLANAHFQKLRQTT